MLASNCPAAHKRNKARGSVSNAHRFLLLPVTAPAAASQADLAPGRRPEVVGAVIVTYFAEPSALALLTEAIRPQVERVLVVDNTPTGEADVGVPDGTNLIRNGRNLGLAAAQNQGIEALRSSGATHVLLLDQDSLPADDMVVRLIAALRLLAARQLSPAAVGPRWHDRLSGRDAPFVRLGLGRMLPASDEAADGVIECDTLVSSGCLIPMAVLDAVGTMDPELFIDQIDTEWGLRAQRLGMRLYGVAGAELTHGIGDSFVRPWFARSRSIPVHSPVRDYFLVRNTVEVFFRRRAPWRWRLLQAVRLPGLLLAMATQMPQRLIRVRYALRGLRDGLLGRLGPARLS